MPTGTDLSTFRMLLEPIVTFFTAMILSGVGAAYLTQFMKADIIPVPVQKYKRTTAAVLSVVATLISLYMTDLNYAFNNLFAVVGFFAGVFLVSAWTYRNVIKSASKEEVPDGK